MSPFNEIDVIIPKKKETENIENSSNSPLATRIVGLETPKIRKTSISMPNKLDEMDDLRIDDEKVKTKNSVNLEFF